MSLVDLDTFLALRQTEPALADALAGPIDMDVFLELVDQWGFALTESDVLEAQQRAMEGGSAATLQQAQAAEARRLRNFIHG